MTLNDFLPLAGSGWVGTSRVRQENDVLKWRPVALDVTLEGGDTVGFRFAALDDSGEQWSLRLKLGDDGRVIDGMSVIERTEIPPDRLAITALGRDEASAGRRLRVLVSRNEFRFERQLERKTGVLELQGEYLLTRP